MTNQKALIRAERVGDGLALNIQGRLQDILLMYQEITTQVFKTLVMRSKEDKNEEIAAHSVNSLIHALIYSAGVAFDGSDSLNQELKPFVQDAFRKAATGFDKDIDIFFAEADDKETCKKSIEKMLDDLHNEAEEASKKGDIRAMMDVLSTLAVIASAVRDAHEENTK